MAESERTRGQQPVGAARSAERARFWAGLNVCPSDEAEPAGPVAREEEPSELVGTDGHS